MDNSDGKNKRSTNKPRHNNGDVKRKRSNAPKQQDKNGVQKQYKRSDVQQQNTRTGAGKKDANQKKKVGINARNDKAKYSDDEIARARYVDSKAKFLVRDRIHNDNIDTRNKWIGISNIKIKERWDSKGNYDPEILSFDAEIFDRTEQPQYEENMTEDEKHQLTYEVAEGDISKQRAEEKRAHRKVDRPSYHVDVSTKIKDDKTEYKVNNITRKK